MEADVQEERGRWEIEKRSLQSELDSRLEELGRLQSQNNQHLKKTEVWTLFVCLFVFLSVSLANFVCLFVCLCVVI